MKPSPALDAAIARAAAEGRVTENGRQSVKTRRKYRNVPTVVDGHRFDSKAEAARYGELKLLERAGKIGWLQCQPAYDLHVGHVKICRYVADFLYLDRETMEWVVEDVKGMKTRDYAIKKKLMKACLGVTVQEIKKAKKRRK